MDTSLFPGVIFGISVRARRLRPSSRSPARWLRWGVCPFLSAGLGAEQGCWDYGDAVWSSVGVLARGDDDRIGALVPQGAGPQPARVRTITLLGYKSSQR